MKTIAEKEQFIKARAEGLSIRKAAEKVGISKDTGQRWENKFSDRINEEKKNRLQEISHEYGLSKINRIESLGKLLKRIEDQIQKTDFEKIPADKLLSLHIKILREISRENTPVSYSNASGSEDISNTLKERVSLLMNRVSMGELTIEQATAEISIINAASNVYKETEAASKYEELERRIEELEALVEQQNRDEEE